MTQEFEGDLRGAVFWGADLRDAVFRDVDLTGARVSHARFVDIDIDCYVDRVVINGVDVTSYVNERDRWYPLRSMLVAPTPEEMRDTWRMLEEVWAGTLTRAGQLDDERLHESVDGEWSFVQTMRHLVFAMDKWFTAPVLGEAFHPAGLPNSGSVDFPWPGLDYGQTPSVAEALALRGDRSARFRNYLEEVTTAELERSVDVLENGPHTVRDCIHTVFEEEFWHNRYALRDLDRLAESA